MLKTKHDRRIIQNIVFMIYKNSNQFLIKLTRDLYYDIILS